MAVSAIPMEHVRVVKSATCGRKLVFTSRFAPGQCILEELPYAYTLQNDKRGRFCEFCLRQCSTLQKCSRCKYVSYCNASCQKGDWTRCHKQECKVLKKWPIPGIHLLSQFTRKQSRSPPCTHDDDDCFPTTIDQLECHNEKLSDMERWILQSGFLSQPEFLSQLHIHGSMLTISNVLGAIQCNSFLILDENLIGIAVGIYLRASMANHSCDYNCTVVFDGRKLQLRTIKDVKEGEECSISYVNVMNPAKERRVELEQKYYFTCKCVKCVEEIDPDDGLGEKLQVLKKSWKKIQVAVESRDWAKVLQLGEPYLKPMDSPPANHHIMVKVRVRAMEACMFFEDLEKAAEIGKLNIEPYRYHCGPYSAKLGIHLLGMANILFEMGRLQEARKYLTEAKSVLEVTHGPQHSLMMTPSVQKLLCRFR